MNAQAEPGGKSPGSSPGTGWEARPDRGTHPMPPNGHPTDALREAMAKLGELKEFASYYVAARIDAIKIGIRNAGIYAGLGIVGAIAGGTIVVMAVVLLLNGIAEALGALFGGRVWLGDIIVGALILIVLAIGIVVGMKYLTGTFKTSTVRKYEQRQTQQRQQFGRDVRDEATAAARNAGRKA